jgi:hypothetical protein
MQFSSMQRLQYAPSRVRTSCNRIYHDLRQAPGKLAMRKVRTLNFRIVRLDVAAVRRTLRLSSGAVIAERFLI